MLKWNDIQFIHKVSWLNLVSSKVVSQKTDLIAIELVLVGNDTTNIKTNLAPCLRYYCNFRVSTSGLLWIVIKR